MKTKKISKIRINISKKICTFVNEKLYKNEDSGNTEKYQ